MAKFRTVLTVLVALTCFTVVAPASAQTRAGQPSSSVGEKTVTEFHSISASWGDEDDYSRVAAMRDVGSGVTTLYLNLAVPSGYSYGYYEATSTRSDASLRVAKDLSWAAFNGVVTVFRCRGSASPCPLGRRYEIRGVLSADGELVKDVERDEGNVNWFRGKLVTKSLLQVDRWVGQASYATVTHNRALVPVGRMAVLSNSHTPSTTVTATAIVHDAEPRYPAGFANAYTPGYDVGLWAKTYHCVFNGWVRVRVNWQCKLTTPSGTTLSTHSGSFTNGTYSTPLYYFKTANTYLCDNAAAGYNDGSASDYDKKCQ